MSDENNLNNNEGMNAGINDEAGNAAPDADKGVNEEYINLIKQQYDVEKKEDGTETVKIDDEQTAAELNVEKGAELSIDENGSLHMPPPPPVKKDGKFEEINSSEPKTKNPFKKIARWYKRLPKKKKIIYAVIAVILCIVIILGAAVGIFVNNKFNLMGDKFDESKGDDKIYEEGDFETITGDVGSSDFKEALIKWATTGDNSIMSSKNVINVLLIGADSRYGKNEGNTDVMMLVSLNRKTKQIKMVSFLRDSYLYVEGKNASYCTKLNAAYSMGGPEVLLTTIEHNFKVDIDGYVMVNFESFKAIIDAMGGVTVDVQKYEASYGNNKYNMNMPYGEGVKLTGDEALIFCRIRGCDADGDVSRTRRQRQVVNSVMDMVKSASISDLNKYLDIILPYVYTSFSNSEVVSLGMKALTGGWASFERSQIQMPLPDARIGGYAGSAWIWVVDYQLSAQALQNELYGMTNIELPDSRITLIDLYNGKSGSGSSSSSGSGTSKEPEKTTADAGNESKTTTQKPVKDTTAVNTTVNATSESNPTETQTAPVTETPTVPVTEPVTEPPTSPATEPPVTKTAA